MKNYRTLNILLSSLFVENHLQNWTILQEKSVNIFMIHLFRGGGLLEVVL